MGRKMMKDELNQVEKQIMRSTINIMCITIYYINLYVIRPADLKFSVRVPYKIYTWKCVI